MVKKNKTSIDHLDVVAKLEEGRWWTVDGVFARSEAGGGEVADSRQCVHL